MSSYAAALLDDLMGRNRNNDPNAKQRDLDWADQEVCKHHLCEFCPNELFTNTKADLGACTKIHDEELKKGYKKSSRYMRMGYEEDFLVFLEGLITDVDKRITRGHKRLEITANHLTNQKQTVIQAQQQRIDNLTDEINRLAEKIEQQGCQGLVEEAQATMKILEQKTEDRKVLEDAKSNPNGANAPKEMEVCPICGAFLVVGDAPQRVEEHLQGKQHIGYARVRDAISMIRKKLRGEDPERDARLKKEREEHEKIKSREREDRRGPEDRPARHRSRSSSRSRHSKSDVRSRRSGSKDRRKSRDMKERKRSRDRRERNDSSERKRSRREESDRKSKERRRSGSRGRRDNDREVKDGHRENGHDRK